MENVVDDVFDDVLELDEVFDEGMEAAGIVFCVLDDGSVKPDKVIFTWLCIYIWLCLHQIISVYYLIVSEWQGGSWGSLCNVNQGSRQQQKTLKYEKIIDLLTGFL